MDKLVKKSKPILWLVLTAFVVNTLFAQQPVEANVPFLPAPGVLVPLTPSFTPPLIRGIKIFKDNPFKFEFVISQGDDLPFDETNTENNYARQVFLKDEAARLVKYFLASLTIPERDMWVNLSPYERHRIIPQALGTTQMGKELLAQDYLLKQVTASIMYPDGEVGREFWRKIYQEAYRRFGTTNVPVNTFNKVWIVPQTAVVYENAADNTAVIVDSKLKVMLEEDYLAMQKHTKSADIEDNNSKINALGSDVIRQIIIPELNKEVNYGRNFAQLRQVYHSLILAIWYKNKLRQTLIAKGYVDRRKINGVEVADKNIDLEIYRQYLKSYKKGVYNYIKEDLTPDNQVIPRKYFSGGVSWGNLAGRERFISGPDSAQMATRLLKRLKMFVVTVGLAAAFISVMPSSGFAQNAPVPQGLVYAQNLAEHTPAHILKGNATGTDAVSVISHAIEKESKQAHYRINLGRGGINALVGQGLIEVDGKPLSNLDKILSRGEHTVLLDLDGLRKNDVHAGAGQPPLQVPPKAESKTSSTNVVPALQKPVSQENLTHPSKVEVVVNKGDTLTKIFNQSPEIQKIRSGVPSNRLTLDDLITMGSVLITSENGEIIKHPNYNLIYPRQKIIFDFSKHVDKKAPDAGNSQGSPESHKKNTTVLQQAVTRAAQDSHISAKIQSLSEAGPQPVGSPDKEKYSLGKVNLRQSLSAKPVIEHEAARAKETAIEHNWEHLRGMLNDKQAPYIVIVDNTYRPLRVFSKWIGDGSGHDPQSYLDFVYNSGFDANGRPNVRFEIRVPPTEGVADLSKIDTWKKLDDPQQIEQWLLDKKSIYVQVFWRDDHGKEVSGVIEASKKAAEVAQRIMSAALVDRNINSNLSQLLGTPDYGAQIQMQAQMFRLPLDPNDNQPGNIIVGAYVERDEFGLVTRVTGYIKARDFGRAVSDIPGSLISGKHEIITISQQGSTLREIKPWPYASTQVLKIYSFFTDGELQRLNDPQTAAASFNTYLQRDGTPQARGQIILGNNMNIRNLVDVKTMESLAEYDRLATRKYKGYLGDKLMANVAISVANVGLSFTGLNVPVTSLGNMFLDLMERPDQIGRYVPDRQTLEDLYAKLIILHNIDSNNNYRNEQNRPSIDAQVAQDWNSMSEDKKQALRKSAVSAIKGLYNDDDMYKFRAYIERINDEKTKFFILNQISMAAEIASHYLPSKTATSGIYQFQVPTNQALYDVLSQRYISLTGELNVPNIVSLLAQGKATPYVSLKNMFSPGALLNKILSIVGVTVDLKSLANELSGDINNPPFPLAPSKTRINFYLLGFPISLINEKELVGHIDEILNDNVSDAFIIEDGHFKSAATAFNTTEFRSLYKVVQAIPIGKVSKIGIDGRPLEVPVYEVEMITPAGKHIKKITIFTKKALVENEMDIQRDLRLQEAFGKSLEQGGVVVHYGADGGTLNQNIYTGLFVSFSQQGQDSFPSAYTYDQGLSDIFFIRTGNFTPAERNLDFFLNVMKAQLKAGQFQGLPKSFNAYRGEAADGPDVSATALVAQAIITYETHQSGPNRFKYHQLLQESIQWLQKVQQASGSMALPNTPGVAGRYAEPNAIVYTALHNYGTYYKDSHAFKAAENIRQWAAGLWDGQRHLIRLGETENSFSADSQTRWFLALGPQAFIHTFLHDQPQDLIKFLQAVDSTFGVDVINRHSGRMVHLLDLADESNAMRRVTNMGGQSIMRIGFPEVTSEFIGALKEARPMLTGVDAQAADALITRYSIQLMGMADKNGDLPQATEKNEDTAFNGRTVIGRFSLASGVQYQESVVRGENIFDLYSTNHGNGLGIMPVMVSIPSHQLSFSELNQGADVFAGEDQYQAWRERLGVMIKRHDPNLLYYDPMNSQQADYIDDEGRVNDVILIPTRESIKKQVALSDENLQMNILMNQAENGQGAFPHGGVIFQTPTGKRLGFIRGVAGKKDAVEDVLKFVSGLPVQERSFINFKRYSNFTLHHYTLDGRSQEVVANIVFPLHKALSSDMQDSNGLRSTNIIEDGLVRFMVSDQIVTVFNHDPDTGVETSTKGYTNFAASRQAMVDLLMAKRTDQQRRAVFNGKIPVEETGTVWAGYINPHTMTVSKIGPAKDILIKRHIDYNTGKITTQGYGLFDRSVWEADKDVITYNHFDAFGHFTNSETYKNIGTLKDPKKGEQIFEDTVGNGQDFPQIEPTAYLKDHKFLTWIHRKDLIHHLDSILVFDNRNFGRQVGEFETDAFTNPLGHEFNFNTVSIPEYKPEFYGGRIAYQTNIYNAATGKLIKVGQTQSFDSKTHNTIVRETDVQSRESIDKMLEPVFSRSILESKKDSLGRDVVTENQYPDDLHLVSTTKINGVEADKTNGVYDTTAKQWTLEQTRLNYHENDARQYTQETDKIILSARGHLIYQDAIYPFNLYTSAVSNITYKEENRRSIPDYDIDGHITRMTEGELTAGGFVRTQFTDFSGYGDFFAAQNSLTTRIVNGKEIPYTKGRLPTSPDEYRSSGRLKYEFTSLVYGPQDQWLEVRDKDDHVFSKIEQAKDDRNRVIGERVTTYDPNSFDVQYNARDSYVDIVQTIQGKEEKTAFTRSIDATTLLEAQHGLIRSQITNLVNGQISQELKDRRGRVIENPIGVLNSQGVFVPQRFTAFSNFNGFDIAHDSFTNSRIDGGFVPYTKSELLSSIGDILTNKNISFRVTDFVHRTTQGVPMQWVATKDFRGRVTVTDKSHKDESSGKVTHKLIVSTYKGIPGLLDVADSSWTNLYVNDQLEMWGKAMDGKTDMTQAKGVVGTTIDESHLMTKDGKSIEGSNVNSVAASSIWNQNNQIRYQGTMYGRDLKSTLVEQPYEGYLNPLGNNEIMALGHYKNEEFVIDHTEYSFFENGENQYGNFDIATTRYATNMSPSGVEMVSDHSNNTKVGSLERDQTNPDNARGVITYKRITEISSLHLPDKADPSKVYQFLSKKTDGFIWVKDASEERMNGEGQQLCVLTGSQDVDKITGFPKDNTAQDITFMDYPTVGDDRFPIGSHTYHFKPSAYIQRSDYENATTIASNNYLGLAMAEDRNGNKVPVVVYDSHDNRIEKRDITGRAIRFDGRLFAENHKGSELAVPQAITFFNEIEFPDYIQRISGDFISALSDKTKRQDYKEHYVALEQGNNGYYWVWDNQKFNWRKLLMENEQLINANFLSGKQVTKDSFQGDDVFGNKVKIMDPPKAASVAERGGTHMFRDRIMEIKKSKFSKEVLGVVENGKFRSLGESGTWWGPYKDFFIGFWQNISSSTGYQAVINWKQTLGVIAGIGLLFPAFLSIILVSLSRLMGLKWKFLMRGNHLKNLLGKHDELREDNRLHNNPHLADNTVRPAPEVFSSLPAYRRLQTLMGSGALYTQLIKYLALHRFGGRTENIDEGIVEKYREFILDVIKDFGGVGGKLGGQRNGSKKIVNGRNVLDFYEMSNEFFQSVNSSVESPEPHDPFKSIKIKSGSAEFSADEFQGGQLGRLVNIVQKKMRFILPGGVDPVAWLNELMKNEEFMEELLQMGKKNLLNPEAFIGTLDFQPEEFTDDKSAEDLVGAVRTRMTGTEIPRGGEPIDVLNDLLKNPKLYKYMEKHPKSTNDLINKVEKGEQLRVWEIKRLNRILFEANYNAKTPHNPILDLGWFFHYKNSFTKDEMRSILEETFPDETPQRNTQTLQNVIENATSWNPEIIDRFSQKVLAYNQLQRQIQHAARLKGRSWITKRILKLPIKEEYPSLNSKPFFSKLKWVALHAPWRIFRMLAVILYTASGEKLSKTWGVIAREVLIAILVSAGIAGTVSAGLGLLGINFTVFFASLGPVLTGGIAALCFVGAFGLAKMFHSSQELTGDRKTFKFEKEAGRFHRVVIREWLVTVVSMIALYIKYVFPVFFVAKLGIIGLTWTHLIGFSSFLLLMFWAVNSFNTAGLSKIIRKESHIDNLSDWNSVVRTHQMLLGLPIKDAYRIFYDTLIDNLRNPQDQIGRGPIISQDEYGRYRSGDLTGTPLSLQARESIRNFVNKWASVNNGNGISQDGKGALNNAEEAVKNMTGQNALRVMFSAHNEKTWVMFDELDLNAQDAAPVYAIRALKDYLNGKTKMDPKALKLAVLALRSINLLTHRYYKRDDERISQIIASLGEDLLILMDARSAENEELIKEKILDYLDGSQYILDNFIEVKWDALDKISDVVISHFRKLMKTNPVEWDLFVEKYINKKPPEALLAKDLKRDLRAAATAVELLMAETGRPKEEVKADVEKWANWYLEDLGKSIVSTVGSLRETFTAWKQELGDQNTDSIEDFVNARFKVIFGYNDFSNPYRGREWERVWNLYQEFFFIQNIRDIEEHINQAGQENPWVFTEQDKNDKPVMVFYPGSYQFQAFEFDKSLDKIDPLLHELGKSKRDFDNIEAAVAWLNNDVTSFRLYERATRKSIFIDNLLPEGFEGFNNDQMLALAGTFRGQQIKRAILTYLYDPKTVPRVFNPAFMMRSHPSKVGAWPLRWPYLDTEVALAVDSGHRFTFDSLMMTPYVMELFNEQKNLGAVAPDYKTYYEDYTPASRAFSKGHKVWDNRIRSVKDLVDSENDYGKKFFRPDAFTSSNAAIPEKNSEDTVGGNLMLQHGWDIRHTELVDIVQSVEKTHYIGRAFVERFGGTIPELTTAVSWWKFLADKNIHWTVKFGTLRDFSHYFRIYLMSISVFSFITSFMMFPFSPYIYFPLGLIFALINYMANQSVNSLTIEEYIADYGFMKGIGTYCWDFWNLFFKWVSYEGGNVHQYIVGMVGINNFSLSSRMSNIIRIGFKDLFKRDTINFSLKMAALLMVPIMLAPYHPVATAINGLFIILVAIWGNPFMLNARVPFFDRTSWKKDTWWKTIEQWVGDLFLFPLGAFFWASGQLIVTSGKTVYTLSSDTKKWSAKKIKRMIRHIKAKSPFYNAGPTDGLPVNPDQPPGNPPENPPAANLPDRAMVISLQKVFDTDPAVVMAEKIVSGIPNIANPGGIDLSHTEVRVQASGEFIQTSFNDPAMLNLLLNSDGLTPIIYNIKTMTPSMVNNFVGVDGKF